MAGRRILVGLAAVAVGSALFVDRLGGAAVVGGFLRRWWPLLLVVLGLGYLISTSSQRWAVVGPLMIIALGGVLLPFTLGAIDRDVFPMLWPAGILLAGAGLALIGADWGHEDLPSRNQFRRFVLLRGTRVASTASSFRRANITAVFASFQLDLRRATLRPGAVINVTAIFATVDVRIGRGVEVQLREPFVLDRRGLRLETPSPSGPAELTINVLGFFGSVTTRESPLPQPREGFAS
jgi:hypothetical protein